MRFLAFLVSTLSALVFAAEQEQPTPYDLIRPIWPMKWDTSATDDGGTVESFSKYTPNLKKHNTVPPVGAMPQDFIANGIIPDTLNQAFRDAQNLRIGRVRVNQAGYLPDDPEKQFYYVSAGACGETFSVVDLNGKSVFDGGSFANTGYLTSSTWDIKAGTDAATNNQGRYTAHATGPSGEICIGNLTQATGLQTNTRYRIKVGNQYSSTFIISDKVYSMVRDATLKFYGINRSGNSESWFHKPSHTKDGAGKFVQGVGSVAGFTPKEGALQGGWYDCGDHLKESQTQAYAFMVLAVMAASSPDRDEDHYAYNMGETVNTDGIPDILREAKHGADFFLRAFAFAEGVVDNMAVSVGNFGADHGWWGRPENQDALPATLTGRGGPHERDIRLGELGSNISGQIAAGLAILSKDYAVYDKPFADSCLMVAKKMYDFAKNLKLKEKNLGPGTYDGGKPYVYNTEADGWSSPAYNGNNESHDDLAIAAIALHYATYEKTGKMDYLNDAVEDKQIGVPQEASVGFFHGGWMAWNRDGMRKSSKNTSWANAYTFTLYGFYKMLLKDKETGLKYGIDDKTRLTYAENVAYTLATNLMSLSGSGSASITLPGLFNSNPVSYGDIWYNMQTDQTWIYNRYQAGNIFEVLAYSDVTKDLEGVNLPQKGMQNWNSAEMKQLGINQLNYMLGVNPWDVSFLLGVGDKNDAHPHHRASNPEGKNMPGAGYKYNPPTGALFGGVTPGDKNAWSPSTLSWEDYHLSETCIDATAMFVASCAVAVREEDRNRAPSQVNVEIRYVGYDSAIVNISQDIRGQAMILYSDKETGPYSSVAADTVPGVKHTIHMKNLKNGTTYYFKVVAINARSERYSTRWLVDSTLSPFYFTTLASEPPAADIQNVKVCNLSSDSAEIMWYTPNGQYESKIYWDTVLTTYDKMHWNTGDANADVSGIPTSFHYVKIGGLKEQTTYYYCVESNGVQRCTDDNGIPLKFTTPVTHYDFDVSVYQYDFGGMDFLNLNLINNEDRAFNELTLRMYVTARPDEIEAVPGVNNQPGSCPLLADEDICQAYDEAGFNRPCVNQNGESVDDSIRYYLRHAVPVKLDDTYDPATGTYDWYIPIPLGGTTIKSSSRMRIDIGFSSGIYQNGGCETLRTPAKKRFVAGGASSDWSWAAHKRDVDGADYAGVPAWDKDQGDIEQAPKNPYIVVYRKDEFISGFSPSYKEMTTKRAHYDMTIAYEAPFNVSNGSYVKIDSVKSTMHLKGTALISESGFVTAIWVNGVALTKDQLKTAAVYNYETGKFDLDIPVKMTIGTNKVDVTVFAGPNPECDECQENGGCAFVNRSYYVQFSKGDRTAGILTLVKEDGTSVSSPAATDGSLKFYVLVKDKDNRSNKTIRVLVENSRTGVVDTLTLNRVNETTGEFKSDLITAIAEKDVKLPKVSFFGGDEITVTYIDAEDEEDVATQYFFADPTHPVPQDVVVQDTDCNARGDKIVATFSGSTFGNGVTLDSALFEFDSTTTTKPLTVLLKPSSVNGAEAVFTPNAGQVPQTGAPTGLVTFYITEKGVVTTEKAPIKDGIAPTLKGVTILENENHQYAQDTLKIIFTEPVMLASYSVWPLRVTDGSAEVSQAGISVVSASTSDNGRSWLYVIEGNINGEIFKPGQKAEILADFAVSDLGMNGLSNCAGPVTVTESVRPVPVTFARITDKMGDGQPEEIYLEFESLLREKDMLDSFDIYWGSPEIYRAFKNQKDWSLDTIQGDPVIKPILAKIDSSMKIKQVSYKEVIGQDTVWCNQTKMVEDTTTHTMVEVDVLDPITGLPVKYACSYKDKTKDAVKNDTIWNYVIDTTGHDTLLQKHTAMRIKVPEGVFLKKTYGSRGGKGSVMPRKGEEGGFFDKSYTLNDDCPPVLMAARLSKYGSTYALRVELSEPLAASGNDKGHFLERFHEGLKSYYRPSDTKLDKYLDVMFWTFSFHEDDADNNVHIGDSLRLPTKVNSITKDKANLLPGEESPWVPVVGEIEDVRFRVKMAEGVSTTAKSDDLFAGNMPEKDEDFRLSVLSGSEETLIANGKKKLTPYSSMLSYDTAAYKHGGPVFNIDVEMPILLQKDSLDNFAWKAHIAFTLDIYTNMGAHVTQTEYEFDLDEIGIDKLSADGTIHLKLEWLPHDGNPVAENGRAIATGPYVSKFIFHTKEVSIAPTANKKYRAGMVKKQNKEKRISMGYRRIK